MKRKHKKHLIGDGLGMYGLQLFREQMDAVNRKIREMEQEKQNSDTQKRVMA